MGGYMSDDDDDYFFYHEHPEYDTSHLYSDGPDSEEEKDELEEDLDLYAGMDMDDFELLSDEEKLEALKDAGLDPEDYADHFDNFEEARENAELEEMAEDYDMTLDQIKLLLDNDIDPEDFYHMSDGDKYEELRKADIDPEDFKDTFYDYEEVISNQIAREYADDWDIDEDDVQELTYAGVDLKEFDEADDEDKLQMLLEADFDPEDYKKCFDDEDYYDDLKGSLGGIDPYELVSSGISLEVFRDMDDLERIEALLAADLDPSDLDGYYDMKFNGVPVEDLVDNEIDLTRFMEAAPEEQLQMLLDKDLDPEEYKDFSGLKYYQPPED